MARSSILAPTNDLQSDSGAVLWSIIRGEQLEYPITLSFIDNVSAGYTFEAVVVEALNVEGQTTRPETIKPGGVQTTLVVRVPVDKGAWSAVAAYDREDIVSYTGSTYKRKTGVAIVSATPPSSDPNWESYIPNKVYVQFPSTLSITPTWSYVPTSTTHSYGFFELRVTEPNGAVYRRTWKPMRGLVEIQFSPTEMVAD
jgi:hypothetical protein